MRPTISRINYLLSVAGTNQKPAFGFFEVPIPKEEGPILMRSMVLLLSFCLIACSAIGCASTGCGTDCCSMGGMCQDAGCGCGNVTADCGCGNANTNCGCGTATSDCGCNGMNANCGCDDNSGIFGNRNASRGNGRFGRRRGVPFTDTGMASGPASPHVGYPYYTNRGPRDFLVANPPSIGR